MRKDTLLNRILVRCGAYYHGAGLFYQELWRQRLVSIGFRVLLIEKLPLHEVWDIRVCGNLTTQTYLLLSKPVPKRYLGTPDVLLKQFRAEIQEIARDLGPPIKSDCITVVRRGSYWKPVSFGRKANRAYCSKEKNDPRHSRFSSVHGYGEIEINR